MKVRVGRTTWYICDSLEPTPQAPFEYGEFHGSEGRALQFLGQFRLDPAAISDLHRFWARLSPEILSDDALLRTFSWWLTTGRIKAIQLVLPIVGGGVVESAPQAPPSRRSAERPSSGPSEEPSTLPSDADPAAIAAAQRDAAESGVPFCEECLKAQLAGLGQTQSQDAAAAENGGNAGAPGIAAGGGEPGVADDPTVRRWVEVQLLNSLDQPVPGAAYQITLPDGSEKTGNLDDNGCVRFDDILPGDCQVTFPDYDAAGWKRADSA